MRKHNGMRPQDIVVLAKIILVEKKKWTNKSLSEDLNISAGEISESLNRSSIARLIDENKRRVNKEALYEFLVHGFSYVFPVAVGTLQRGTPTAHSHPFMENLLHSSVTYVWPFSQSDAIGLALEPLYDKQVLAVKKDEDLYKLLALLDVLRIGKTREVELAKTALHKVFFDDK